MAGGQGGSWASCRPGQRCGGSGQSEGSGRRQMGVGESTLTACGPHAGSGGRTVGNPFLSSLSCGCGGGGQCGMQDQGLVLGRSGWRG